MSEQELSKLINLTINKDTDTTKKTLEEFEVKQKGKLFEAYLAELFKGNGWLTVINGGRNDGGADILLYHPKQPEKVFVIVQAKNFNRPLTYDETKIELIKFEEKSKNLYNCNSYILISINGFAKNAKKLEEFNMKLEEWEYISRLIESHSQIPTEEPNIELYAHNKIAYENSRKLLKHTNRVAFIQATGTGKSYILVKYLAGFIDKKSIVLAPTTHILKQLKNICLWASKNTTFMTYAKLKNFNDKSVKLLKYDLVILDEFHRCGAEFWGKGVERLINNNIKSVILGTSATPIRYSDNERDMSDELFQNNVAVNLSLAEAIVKKILPMPIYISALYTIDEEISKLSNKINNSNIHVDDKDILSNKLVSIKKDWDKSSGIPYVLKKYINNNENKFIIFCENKEHLYEMEWLVEKWFVKADIGKRIKKYRVVSGDKEASKELADFKKINDKSKIYLLFAIDILNEGVHINDVSGVILLRNTKSPRIFYQQIGRAIQSGNVENPIIFDFVNNFNSIRTRDFLDDLEEAKLRENSNRSTLGLTENYTAFTIIDETKETIELFEELENKLNDIWEYWYLKLVEYNNIHQTTIVSKEEYDELSYWCYTQRNYNRNQKLSKERIDKLNILHFIWDINDYNWVQMYNQLVEYKKNHGDCVVPKNYYDKKFWFWVGTQRRLRFPIKERVDLLNKIEYVWGNDDIWNIKFEKLKEFKAKYGHCNVPVGYTSEGISLYSWLQHQKVSSKGQQNIHSFTDERKRLLEELGVYWSRIDYKWQIMFEMFCEHKQKTGKTSIGRNDNLTLSHWIAVQRKYYRRDKITEERKEKLLSVGFDFQCKD